MVQASAQEMLDGRPFHRPPRQSVSGLDTQSVAFLFIRRNDIGVNPKLRTSHLFPAVAGRKNSAPQSSTDDTLASRRQEGICRHEHQSPVSPINDQEYPLRWAQADPSNIPDPEAEG